MGHSRMVIDIALHARNGQGPRGLSHTAGVFKYVLDGGANFIHVYHHHVIDVFLGDLERFLTNLSHADAIGE